MLTFEDPYELQGAIRTTEARVAVTAPGPYRASLTHVEFDRLWLQRCSCSLPQIIHSSSRKDRSPIFFLTSVRQAPMIHRGIELQPSDLMFYSRGSNHHIRNAGQCSWGTLSLHPNHLAAAGRALLGRELVPPAVTHSQRPSSGDMARLITLHDAAASLASAAPDILTHSEASKAVEQALVRAMVACLSSDGSNDTHRPRHGGLAVMRRLERVLAANEDKPLYLAEVCAAVGASERTLRLHCREHLGMSPHRYLWLRRMAQARRSLAQAEPGTTTVTQIALNHGFVELGRFSAAYRGLYGESPSATLRRPPGRRR